MLTTYVNIYICLPDLYTNMYRGVMRLDGTRCIKQVWCPHVWTWALSEANVLYWRKCLWHFWTFRRPSSDSAPGELHLLVTPLICSTIILSCCVLVITIQGISHLH